MSLVGSFCRREWERLRVKFHLHNNFTIRTCCVVLMLKCAFVALTGRGVVSIIQAIVGVIFSIEGFWGAVKYDAATVKRFLVFLVGYFFVSLGISIIDIQTITDYCSTALDDQDHDTCLHQSTIYSYTLLAASIVVVPGIFALGVVFYLSIPTDDGADAARRRRNANSAALEVYEMAERMGFSTD